jgi:hypothetical protein
MKKRQLKLRAERLAELTSAELEVVAGAVQLTGTETMGCPTLPVGHCQVYTSFYPCTGTVLIA